MTNTYDIVIEQGTTLNIPIQWKPNNNVINITNYVITMQIRKFIEDTTVLLELSTTNGKIIITDSVSGVFTVKISPSDTSTATWSNGVYDINILDTNANVYKVLKGTALLNKSVTR